MASFINPLVFSLLLLLLPLSDAQSSFRPRALVLPVRKDASTLQYLTVINQRTPLASVNLVVDLGGEFLWVDCINNASSSTFHLVRCRSAQCSLARSGACDGADVCIVFPFNSAIRLRTSDSLAQDVVSIQSTNGFNPGPIVSVPQLIFSCAPSFLLEGLANGAMGMAGLGRNRVALPSQLASAFSFARKFAICLSSSSDGVMFFGDGPYNFFSGVDASRILTYTPLLNTQPPSNEYYIGVRSIRINGGVVPLNTSLLAINGELGGTRISTVVPYTVMESSIYNAFTTAFIKEAASMNIVRVASVAPFTACFNLTNISPTRLGWAVPSIELVLHSERVVWSMTGSNSMVQVSDDVVCLGFVDGGEATTSIVIGGYQLEDNLLQIDLATSRVGFSLTLLRERTTCANSNFSSNP